LKRTTGSGLVKWRLHTHFEVNRGVPTRIEVTLDGGGAHDERAVLERAIQADHTYIMDRGYAKFALFNAIVAVGRSYGGDRDPEVLRDHRLHADQPVDRPQADTADLRDDLLLSGRLGQ
jgi:hypothetical protein